MMLFKRIKKITTLVVIFGWPLAVSTGYVILKLYGGDYPFDLSLTLLFATAGLCISIDQLYGQLLNSEGINGIKVTSFAAIVLALVNVLLNILLIPQFGLNGAVTATIVGYLSSMGIMLLNRKRLGYSN
jgi:O-antigen/teichoic acid export membrane protein